MQSIFISGLKKQSGKTIIASGLAGTMQSLSYATSYYKPIHTGANLIKNDVEYIVNVDSNIKADCTYIFSSPFSPLVGAYEQGIKKIDKSRIISDFQSNMQMCECHIVEGSNSISSPIDSKFLEIDLVKMLNLPIILTVNPIINNIDDVISGINFITSKNVNFIGAIVNEFNSETNNMEHKYYPQLIKEYTDVRVLGCFPHFENFLDISPESLISATLNNLDIEEIFGLKIAKLA